MCDKKSGSALENGKSLLARGNSLFCFVNNNVSDNKCAFDDTFELHGINEVDTALLFKVSY